MKLQPKNWSNFQHYKDRNPPWIKLHKNQLDKPDFMSLSLASVGLANMLWLLASETKDGVFDASMEHLTFRLRKTERELKTNLKLLIDKGFFIIASGMLADDTDSCSETEVEGEIEVEGDKPKKKNESSLPENYTPSERLYKWATEKHHNVTEDDIEGFSVYHSAKGSCFVDWDSAFMNWMRNKKKFNNDQGSEDEPRGKRLKR